MSLIHNVLKCKENYNTLQATSKKLDLQYIEVMFYYSLHECSMHNYASLLNIINL